MSNPDEITFVVHDSFTDTWYVLDSEQWGDVVLLSTNGDETDE